MKMDNKRYIHAYGKDWHPTQIHQLIARVGQEYDLCFGWRDGKIIAYVEGGPPVLVRQGRGGTVWQALYKLLHMEEGE